MIFDFVRRPVLSEMLRKNKIIDTATGRQILLTDSADSKAIEFDAYGRSEQTTYSGKNLYNCTLQSSTVNGVTFTLNEDKSVTAKGTATATTTIGCGYATLPVGTYIINGAPSDSSVSTKCLMMYDGAKNVFDQGNGTTFTLTEETTVNIQVVVASGVTVDHTFYPMIRLASVTDGTYEPYTNGASPNTDYPQDMSSIGYSGWFDGELLQGAYAIATGLYGSSNANYVCNKNPIPCKPTDVIKLNYEAYTGQLAILFYQADGSYLTNRIASDPNVLFEITAPENAYSFNFDIQNSYGITPQTAGKITITINDKYALIIKNLGEYNGELAQGYYSISSGGTFTANPSAISNLNPIACNSGDKVTVKYNDDNVSNIRILFFTNSGSFISGIDYAGADEITLIAPINANYYHFSILKANISVITAKQIFVGINDVKYIPISAPLRGIGEVEDVARLTDGEVERKFAEVVLNGSEEWLLSGKCYRTVINDVKSATSQMTVANISSSHFTPDSYSNCYNGVNDNIVGVDHANGIVGIYSSRFATVSDFKTWLQSNPITVIYEVAEPVIEVIEPVDIVTYNPVTYIIASDDPDMEIEYYSESGQSIADEFGKLNADTGWKLLREAGTGAGSGGTSITTEDLYYRIVNKTLYIKGNITSLSTMQGTVIGLGNIAAYSADKINKWVIPAYTDSNEVILVEIQLTTSGLIYATIKSGFNVNTSTVYTANNIPLNITIPL